MTEPQYFWQRADLHGSSMMDITEEEFAQLVEEMIEDLEGDKQPEVAP